MVVLLRPIVERPEELPMPGAPLVPPCMVMLPRVLLLYVGVLWLLWGVAVVWGDILDMEWKELVTDA